MLKQRVITALVLLAILLPALFYPSPWPFAGVMLVLMAAGAWEWGRLNGLGMGASLGLGAVCVLLCGASLALGWAQQAWLTPVWVVGGMAWVLVAVLLLRAGVPGWPRIALAVRIVSGVLALWLAWLAAVQARALGVNFLLSVLALVWVADIAAYFAGRAFGLRFTQGKLAPAISPGKSWEGVWGGMAGVVLLALVWVAADSALNAPVPSFYSLLVQQGGWLLLVPVVLGMAAMSVCGDLIESLIKRSAGAKDSSRLLPGHGGVLDRVDALLPTLPLALMVASLVSA